MEGRCQPGFEDTPARRCQDADLHSHYPQLAVDVDADGKSADDSTNLEHAVEDYTLEEGRGAVAVAAAAVAAVECVEGWDGGERTKARRCTIGSESEKRSLQHVLGEVYVYGSQG